MFDFGLPDYLRPIDEEPTYRLDAASGSYVIGLTKDDVERSSMLVSLFEFTSDPYRLYVGSISDSLLYSIAYYLHTTHVHCLKPELGLFMHFLNMFGLDIPMNLIVDAYFAILSKELKYIPHSVPERVKDVLRERMFDSHSTHDLESALVIPDSTLMDWLVFFGWTTDFEAREEVDEFFERFQYPKRVKKALLEEAKDVLRRVFVTGPKGTSHIDQHDVHKQVISLGFGYIGSMVVYVEYQPFQVPAKDLWNLKRTTRYPLLRFLFVCREVLDPVNKHSKETYREYIDEFIESFNGGKRVRVECRICGEEATHRHSQEKHVAFCSKECFAKY